MIYVVQHRASRKLYVGQTRRTLVARWQSHQISARNGSKLHFHNALRKYGAEAFHIYELDPVAGDGCDAAEQMYIALFQSANRKLGYNTALGGNYGKLNETARKRISERMMGNNHGLGKKWTEERKRRYIETRTGVPGKRGMKFTDEHKKKISLAHKGKIVSMLTCQRISESKRGKKLSPDSCVNFGKHRIGKKHSPETKEKMSTARRAWHANQIVTVVN